MTAGEDEVSGAADDTAQMSPERLLESEQQAALRRLAALERDFAGIVESAGQANTDDEHDPEGATLAFERQHIAALLGQARDYLREVEAAKSRLAAGQYGLCEHCERPIPAARLAARPTATSCVTCASRRSR
jgi:DnaK suppressor protein